MFKIGTKVVFSGNHNDTMKPLIKGGTITRVGKDTVWLDSAHKAEDQVYAAFLYPDTPESRAFLQEGIDMSLRQQAERDEYMRRVYLFNNDLVRKGLK